LVCDRLLARPKVFGNIYPICHDVFVLEFTTDYAISNHEAVVDFGSANASFRAALGESKATNVVKVVNDGNTAIQEKRRIEAFPISLNTGRAAAAAKYIPDR
jgi:hypothetical protein